MQSSRRPSKLLAALVSIFLLMSNSLFAHVTEVQMWNERRAATGRLQPATILPKDLGIPTSQHAPAYRFEAIEQAIASFGTIKTAPANQASKGRWLIEIDDVHGHLEAQQNIGSMIAALRDQAGMDMVGL